MIKRILDISEQGYLHLKQKQLVVERDGQTIASVPVEDLGVLILQHPAIVFTQALVIACQENNVVVIFSDSRHLPYSVLLPLSEGNSLHTKVLREQVAVSLPTKKRLWQQIVRQKINQQAETLAKVGLEPVALHKLANKVKSGDPDNCEAQAAQRYWQLLFGKAFRRDPNEPGINALLNYGYSIMRAMIARALVGAGLHPALGLHHRNQYNGLCLADDMMEPFRPWIDFHVYQLLRESGDAELEINQTTKSCLLGLLTIEVQFQKQKMPLTVASHYLASGLKKTFSNSQNKLQFPQLVPVV